MYSTRLIFLLAGLWAAVSAVDLGAVYTSEDFAETDRSILEDAQLNFMQLASKYGYPVETHSTSTKDGYELTLHRIPHGRNGNSSQNGIPVLVQHGLLSSSVDFIIMGPGKALGYLLADEGFDVWFGNSRGNRHSRKHASFGVNSPKFWEFSWHEMGHYDTPAEIDYILNTTGHSSLHYIGHSQGTTQFFTFAVHHPEYHSKIRSAHALSPVAFMKNLKSPVVQILTLFHKPIAFLTQLVGMHEFLPTSEFLNLIGYRICRDEYPFFQAICSNILFLLFGFNPSQLNTTMLPVLMAHTPAGAATRQLIHYAQNVQTDAFKHYDHGFFGNLIKYGSISPPDYKIEDINIPIALYYSDNDWMASVQDVERLADLLPNLIGKYRISHKLFNHFDFIWGIDARPLLFDRVISLIKRY